MFLLRAWTTFNSSGLFLRKGKEMGKLDYLLVGHSEGISLKNVEDLRNSGIGIEVLLARTSKVVLNVGETKKIVNKVYKKGYEIFVHDIASVGLNELLFTPLIGLGMPEKVVSALIRGGVDPTDLLDNSDQILSAELKTNVNVLRKFNESKEEYEQWLSSTESKIDILKYVLISIVYKSISIDEAKLHKLITLRLGNVYANFFDTVLELLKEQQIVEVENGSVKIYEWRLNDVLRSTFENKDIIEARLSGETLEEVGQLKGLTRERIRQLQKKILDTLPVLKEERLLAPTFEKYDFSKADFIKYVGGDSIIYEFINLRHDKGDDPAISYILDSDSIDMQVKSKFLSDRNYFFAFDGQIVPLTRDNVLREVLYEHRDIKFTIESIKEKMESKTRELGGNDEITDTGLRGLIERSKVSITSTKHQFRYFNFSLGEETLSELRDLLEVPDGLYGIDYFFDTNNQLMEELDVREASELANLYKTLGYENFPKINDIIRQSVVVIGNQSLNDYLKDVLLEFEGKTVDSFLEYFEYVPRRIIRSYLKNRFSDWQSENRIVVSLEENDNSVVATDVELHDFLDTATERLGRNVFTLDELKDIQKVMNIEWRITQNSLERVNYVSQSGVIYSQEYSSARSAMQYLLQRNDIFRRTQEGIYQTSLYRSTLRNMLLNHNIFQIGFDTYMNRSRLSSIDVDRLVTNYISDFLDFSNENEFYSFEKLKTQGFESEFDEYGFSDIFYEQLLVNSPKVKVVSSKPVLFTTNSKIITAAVLRRDFLQYQFNKRNGLDIYDFIDELEDEFGLKISIEDLKSELLQNGLYFSNQTKRIYETKANYLEEVYGNVENK